MGMFDINPNWWTGPNSMVGQALPGGLNPGGDAAQADFEANQALTQQNQAEALALAREEADRLRREAALNAPAMARLRRRANFGAADASRLRDRASTDESLAYRRNREAGLQEAGRIGLNPGDPAFGRARTSTAVNRATNVAGLQDQSVNRGRAQADVIAAGLAGQNVSLTGAANTTLGAGALGLGLTNAASGQPGQGLFGVPGLTLKSGGHVRGRAIMAPQGGAVAPAAGPGRGIIQDPLELGPARDIPLVKGPDGSFASPDARPPGVGGHITGPGTETSDSIPAQLSHGEYVQPAFVASTIGTPAQDAIVEVSRLALDGDPEAHEDVRKLVKTIASFKSTAKGAPSRTAGESPTDTQAEQAPASGPRLSHGGQNIRQAAGGGRAIVQRPRAVIRAAHGGGFGERLFGEPDIGGYLTGTPGELPPPGPIIEPKPEDEMDASSFLDFLGTVGTAPPRKRNQTSILGTAGKIAQIVGAFAAHGGHARGIAGRY